MKECYYNIHEELVQRCLKGDRVAQHELYSLYAKAMLNVSCRIVGNPEDAEDILQESFISAFKKLHTYQNKSTFGAWLKRIVINNSLSFAKKNRLNLVPIEDDDSYIEDEVGFDTVDTLTVTRVKNAIDLLPDGYRVVFSLYLIEGYDHSEIADILGITVSTSKSQYNRSKKKLKEILEKEGFYERQA